MPRLAGLLVLCLGAIAHAEWRQVNGPYGYHIESLLATETVLLAGNNVGIFRSGDQGATWENRGTDHAVQGFVVAGKSILAHTRTKVIRSDDEGDTWQTIHNGLTGYIASAMVTMGDDVFLLKEDGVYRSLDQGSLWTRCAPDFDTTQNHDLVAAGAALLVRTGDRLYRSLDHGLTWEAAGVGLPTALDYPSYRSFARSGDYLFTSAQGGVYRSNDFGATWARVPGAPAETVILSLFDDGTRLYFATANGLFRSSDQGVNFQKVNGDVGFRLLPLDVSPQGAGFWMATNRGVYQSRDQGGTFEGSHMGMGAALVNDFLYEGGRLHVASKEGFYSSSDLGATWTLSPESKVSFGMTSLALQGDVLFAGTRSHGVHKSTDRGKTWLPANDGLMTPDEYVLAVVAEGTYLHAATLNGVYRSDDGGGSWSKYGSGLPDQSSSGLAVEDGSLFGWIGNQVFRSTDHGSTWTASGDTVAEPIDKLAVAGSTVVVVGSTWIHHSMDRGATWSARRIPLMNDLFTALEATPGGFFAGTATGKILHSSNSGAGWTSRNEGIDWETSEVTGFVVAGDQVLVGSRGIFKRPLSAFGVISVRRDGLRPSTAKPRPGFALRMLRRLGVDLRGRSMGPPGQSQ